MADFKVQTLEIDGMHCDGCVQRVTQALGSIPGVRVNAVHVGTAHVLAEPECAPLLQQAIEKAGFRLQSMHGEG